MRASLRLRIAVEQWALHVWYGQGLSARLLRLLLTPASVLFGLIIRQRNARFDAESTDCGAGELPVVSVGNLTVGGTGKTPVASWVAMQLQARGGRPAIVLRGYGDDEWRVHALLTPGIPVFVAPVRQRGVEDARAAGCDCVVLDDAFQHRQVPRISDVVVVSADRWDGQVRLLPAGPYREPLTALRRASVVIVTGKAVSDAQLAQVRTALVPWVGGAAIVRVRLRPAALEPAVPGASGSRLPLDALSHGQWMAVSAIGDPSAFEGQLRSRGARLVRHWRFPDHHPFTAEEATALASEAQGGMGVVCTLKDAVKLGPLWPRAAVPLWYVSQTLEADRDNGILERECDRVLAARAVRTSPAG